MKGGDIVKIVTSPAFTILVGTICANILEGNTFYVDHHNLVGKCDFVMANPPFNVDGVDKNKDSVKNDPRLLETLDENGGKSRLLPKSDNANYLWIQYFYGYLNPTGRAGFVMASSASDAGHSEKDIREKIVRTGAADVMISIGNKFFYTRSLPCAIWFFDRAKETDPKRMDRTLMLDLRDIYRKVSSNLHDFTPEQLKNIQAIVGLYRGNKDYYTKTIAFYKQEIATALKEAKSALTGILEKELKEEKLSFKIEKQDIQVHELKKVKRDLSYVQKDLVSEIRLLLQNEEVKKERIRRERLQEYLKATENLLKTFNVAADKAIYFDKELHWLISRFPKPEYNDVAGLCKVVSQKEIVENDWSKVADFYRDKQKLNQSTATRFMGEIKHFFEEPEDTLWITFHNRKMYWAFAHSKVDIDADGRRVRHVIGKWSDEDILGNQLTVENLIGSLTVTQGYRSTICRVKVHIICVQGFSIMPLF